MLHILQFMQTKIANTPPAPKHLSTVSAVVCLKKKKLDIHTSYYLRHSCVSKREDPTEKTVCKIFLFTVWCSVGGTGPCVLLYLP